MTSPSQQPRVSVPDPATERTVVEGTTEPHLLLEIREEVRQLRATLSQLTERLANPTPISVSVDDAATRLGCGRTQVFKLLATSKLRRAKKAGRRVMVTVASIDAYQSQERHRAGVHAGQRPTTSLRASIVALPLDPRPTSNR